MNKITTGIQLNQKQELRITADTVQSLAILKMNCVELAEHARKEFLENPVLEEAEYQKTDEYSADIQHDSRKSSEEEYDGWNGSGDDYAVRSVDDSSGVSAFEQFYRRESTLQEHLMEQLHQSPLGAKLRSITEYLIASLDDDGYLRCDMEDVIRKCSASNEELVAAIRVIQGMDPAGVGARSIGECLKLQLEDRGLMDDVYSIILGELLPELASGKSVTAAKRLGMTKAELAERLKVLKSLDPKPGGRYSDGQAMSYAVPDVNVTLEDGMFSVTINQSGIPSIRINPDYDEMLRGGNCDSELKAYLTDKIKSANLLIAGIEQRNRTLMRITEEIIRRQPDYFREGDGALRGMTMQEIADALDIHVSTVSRAISDKYIQMGCRVMPMRQFFAAGVRRSEASGDDDSQGISSEAVKSRIRELIKGEDRRKPLSDSKLAEALAAMGIEISRRTVAKYRDAEGIPPASERKGL